MINPSEIETRFRIEDGMAFMGTIFDEPSEEALGQIEVVRDIMEQLPPREADFVDLYYFRRLKQTDIADLFGVSQPTVCYRLQRATARIQFLLQLPKVESEDLRVDLEAFLTDSLDVRIMLLMKETTCQSEVAKQLDSPGRRVTQGKVRHRFQRTIKAMRHHAELGGEGADRFDLYIRLFEFIDANLNILREVQRPSWDLHVTHILD